jgi:WD40 repeat protein
MTDMMKADLSPGKLLHIAQVEITHLIISAYHRSNDGKLIATGGSMGIVRLWEYDSARLIFEKKGHSLPITSLSFSNDDKLLVSGGEDGAVCIWNVFEA